MISVKLTAVRSPAFSRISFCSAVLNPGALTVTEYVDGFSAGRTNSPVLPVASVYTCPVPVSLMVTFALAIIPPEGSETVPTRVARSRCANAAHAQTRASRVIRGPVKLRYIYIPRSQPLGQGRFASILPPWHAGINGSGMNVPE